jgi:hypothetical protein
MFLEMRTGGFELSSLQLNQNTKPYLIFGGYPTTPQSNRYVKFPFWSPTSQKELDFERHVVL